MLFERIRYRLIFFFVAFVAVVLILSGWTLRWSLRRSLETELGEKLIAVANAVATQFDEHEIAYLLDESGPRVRAYLIQRIDRMRFSTRVQHVFIFDNSGNSLLDSDSLVTWGSPYFRLQFYRREMESLVNGSPAHSILFQGIDGAPTMTGFVPLHHRGTVIGGVGVDGSATFLDAVSNMNRKILFIGILGLLAAVALGTLMADSITRPIARLANISRRIGQGDYHEAIPPLSRGEIQQLAATMEDMRQGVLQRERDLKAMLAGVAHEIRNPLGGIELFAGLLQDELHDSQAIGHVRRIAKETSHLKEVVNSFLNYAKPQDPNREACFIGDMVDDTLLSLQTEIHEKSLKISLPEKPETACIWADPAHVKRILINLVQNAIQASGEREEIRIHWQKKDNDVEINIEDRGEGIPADKRDMIFTPFYTSRKSGTGLGLPIVKELARANGGSIELIHSDPNGTLFRIHLPECDRHIKSASIFRRKPSGGRKTRKGNDSEKERQ